MTIHLLNATASGGHAAGDTLTDIENLIGSAHGDTLTGNANDNTLEGGAGDDTLIGGAGADTLDGGADIDTASYIGSGAGVTVNLLTGEASGGHAAGDTLRNIENLIGSDHNDTLTGNAGDNTLEGGAGADTLDGGEGIDTASYAGSAADVSVNLATGVGIGGDANGDRLSNIENLIGSAYDDTLRGDGNINILRGGAGNDTLQGEGGDDKLYGGADNDTLVGGAGADTLDGGEGNDTASYASSALGVTVNLATESGNGGDAEGDELSDIENLIGSDSGDTLRGDGNANILIGGGSADLLYGEGGDDTLEGGAGRDRVDGGADDDTLYGDGEDDSLYGRGGDDTLDGGADNDRLDGGSGFNILTGGAGEDRFVLKRTADANSRDEVTDFTSGDDVILANTTSSNETTLVAMRAALSIYWTNNSNFNDSTSGTNDSDQNDILIYNFGADGVRGGGDDILMMVLEDYSEELLFTDFDVI